MTRTFLRHIAAAALLFVSAALLAQSAPAPAPQGGIGAVLDKAKKGDDFLPPDQAFRFAALADGSDRVRLSWQIADGYYLYRARIKVATTSKQAQLGATQFPPGQVKNDEYFGRQEVYHHELTATVPVARAAAGTLELPLQVTYQGCADAGLCYPPITKPVSVTLSADKAGAGGGSAAPGTPAGGDAEQSRFVALFSGNIFLMLGGFYVAGLLLAFTPCVLPMVPILSGIIAGGGGNVSAGRGFALSLSYVLGMSVTYTAAGVAGAAHGQGSAGAVPDVVGARPVRRDLRGDGAVHARACSRCRCRPPSRAGSPTSATARARATSAAWRSWAHCRHSSSPPAWGRRWSPRSSSSARPASWCAAALRSLP